MQGIGRGGWVRQGIGWARGGLGWTNCEWEEAKAQVMARRQQQNRAPALTTTRTHCHTRWIVPCFHSLPPPLTHSLAGSLTRTRLAHPPSHSPTYGANSAPAAPAVLPSAPSAMSTTPGEAPGAASTAVSPETREGRCGRMEEGSRASQNASRAVVGAKRSGGTCRASGLQAASEWMQTCGEGEADWVLFRFKLKPWKKQGMLIGRPSLRSAAAVGHTTRCRQQKRARPTQHKGPAALPPLPAPPTIAGTLLDIWRRVTQQPKHPW